MILFKSIFSLLKQNKNNVIKTKHTKTKNIMNIIFFKRKNKKIMDQLPCICKNCGSHVGRFYQQYYKMRNEHIPLSKIFEILNIDDLCCKSTMMTNIKSNLPEQVVKNGQMYTFQSTQKNFSSRQQSFYRGR